MAQIEIIGEREVERGWHFDAQVLDNAGTLRRHALTLAWADYNLWSPDGAASPAAVAAAVLQFMVGCASPTDLKPSFDASISRRLYAEADAIIPTMVAHGP